MIIKNQFKSFNIYVNLRKMVSIQCYSINMLRFGGLAQPIHKGINSKSTPRQLPKGGVRSCLGVDLELMPLCMGCVSPKSTPQCKERDVDIELTGNCIIFCNVISSHV